MINNPASFRAAARWQQVCAVCGSGGPFHAHHVVPEQRLRHLKEPLHDPRNALRLCTNNCHMQFEWAGPGKVCVEWRHFTDENICYIWETLGVTAVQLERKYGAAEGEPRWEKHLRGECELCQRAPSPTTV